VATKEGIDIAMKAVWIPMGPFAVDLVGLDTSLAISTRCSRVRRTELLARPLLRRMVSAVNWRNRDPASTTTSLERSKRERWPTFQAVGDADYSVTPAGRVQQALRSNLARARPSLDCLRSADQMVMTRTTGRAERSASRRADAHLGHMRQLFEGLPLDEITRR